MDLDQGCLCVSGWVGVFDWLRHGKRRHFQCLIRPWCFVNAQTADTNSYYHEEVVITIHEGRSAFRVVLLSCRMSRMPHRPHRSNRPATPASNGTTHGGGGGGCLALAAPVGVAGEIVIAWIVSLDIHYDSTMMIRHWCILLRLDEATSSGLDERYLS